MSDFRKKVKASRTQSVASGQSATTTDNYFGCCPDCGTHDGYINVGSEHWFHCKTHKIAWCIGDNLFSGWREETPDTWQRNNDLIMTYTIIRETDAVDWREINATAAVLLAEVTL